MYALFPLAAFFGVLLATIRSVGLGLCALFAVGYMNGIIRANFLSVHTTFMFDAAVLGLYFGYCFGGARRAEEVPSGFARTFVLFLIAWPIFLSLLPINSFLIQLVALRATVWFLPVLLIATRLDGTDLTVLTRGLVLLNLLALAVGLYIYIHGVEALYPKNAVTQIIYRSNDVAGHKFHRVPSIFLNAHAYGGTMLLTLPLLLDRIAGDRVRLTDRVFAALGAVAVAGGLLLCGARYPQILFALTLAIAWAVSRFSLAIGCVGAVLIGGALLVAGTNERFQRVNSLGDTEAVSKRLHGSANVYFLDLIMDYPGGAGMGSSVGTSIPYFLADKAPEQIGFENEFSRILVDQGWIGLGGWVAFVCWLCARPPASAPPGPWRVGVVFMYSLTLATWASAFIGTGTLSSVPGTVLLLTQMGILVSVRARGAIPDEEDNSAVDEIPSFQNGY